jgi:ubiquitin-protein ligase E3 C
MLARHGVQGADTWVKVVAVLLASVGEGWGKWAEGIPEDDSDIDDGGMEIDSDSEDDLPEERPRPSKSKRQRRQSLPKNISSKLLLLGSTSHVATLADLLVSSSSNQSLNLMTEFAYFILGLLTAFKGTPRWEATLDGLLEGRKGVALTRRMWREGVRGKWGTTRDQTSWQTFTSSEFSSLHNENTADGRPGYALLDLDDPSVLPLPSAYTG